MIRFPPTSGVRLFRHGSPPFQFPFDRDEYGFCFEKGFPTRFGLLTLALVLPLSPDAFAIDFNRDVRPILSENCFHCHGPDAESREADLRLDTQTGSRENLSGSPAIVPKEPDQSELIARIFSDDPGMLMPPPESKRSLSAHQKSILKSWITEAVVYEQHWAFIAPTRPSAPQLDQAAASSHPVDRFIRNRLRERGLEPSQPADRRTLIRRVSLDLTGIPPSPEQVESFVNDSDLNAYERLVDRLLASEQFGERWARPWLDWLATLIPMGFKLTNCETAGLIAIG